MASLKKLLGYALLVCGGGMALLFFPRAIGVFGLFWEKGEKLRAFGEFWPATFMSIIAYLGWKLTRRK